MAEPRKILVVDDSATLRHIVRKELEAGGYLVVEAEDGISAITEAVNHLPDLITMDIDMPNLNGFESCKKMGESHYARHVSRSAGGRVPIVFVTAKDTMEERRRGFELGAADFITKPFAKGEVLEAANKILKPGKRLSGLTALVVDDSETARAITGDILAREGLSIIECEDGTDAFALLENEPSRIDIVITDFDMPKMTGGELCRKLREELRLGDIPIIFLTAIPDRSNLLEVFKAGATDYLVKPFVIEELVARVTTHLERGRLTRRLRETIASLQQANDEIRALSRTDPLTGCFNRAFLTEHLPSEIVKARRYRHPLSILIIDIDHFKIINDTFGHQAGDKVLVRFADCLSRSIRRNVDWVARYGGEEFLIVLPETGLDTAQVTAQRLRAAIEEMVIGVKDRQVTLTASFGVTGFTSLTPDEKCGLDLLIDHADSLLYRAKNEGRNRVITEEL